jgi:hypothetical protein
MGVRVGADEFGCGIGAFLVMDSGQQFQKTALVCLDGFVFGIGEPGCRQHQPADARKKRFLYTGREHD